jgi:hypothetical protein
MILKDAGWTYAWSVSHDVMSKLQKPTAETNGCLFSIHKYAALNRLAVEMQMAFMFAAHEQVMRLPTLETMWTLHIVLCFQKLLVWPIPCMHVEQMHSMSSQTDKSWRLELSSGFKMSISPPNCSTFGVAISPKFRRKASGCHSQVWQHMPPLLKRSTDKAAKHWTLYWHSKSLEVNAFVWQCQVSY